jgi:hypothetical protein
MRISWSLIILCFLPILGFSQEPKTDLSIQVTFQGEQLELGKNYYSDALKDSIQFDKLQFYISNFTIVTEEEEKDTLAKEYHLVDYSDLKTLVMGQISTDRSVLGYEFNLGIDSITNVSGVFGGDLDPTIGMYWTWQSGYINFKLEGKSGVINSRSKEFQFHLGGYSFPNKNVTQVHLKAENIPLNSIELPLDKLIDKIDLKTFNTIMSPSKDAVKLTELIGETFIIQK